MWTITIQLLNYDMGKIYQINLLEYFHRKCCYFANICDHDIFASILIGKFGHVLNLKLVTESCLAALQYHDDFPHFQYLSDEAATCSLECTHEVFINFDGATILKV